MELGNLITRTCTGIVCVVALGIANAQPAAAPERSITQVSDHVYRWGENNFYGAFMVTDDGIILIDTLNRGAAKWIKQELKDRFDLPVRYVILSHDHAYHITGADIFLDTALIVAQENIVPHIVGEKRSTAVPDITYRTSAAISLGETTLELIHDGQSHGNALTLIRIPSERTIVLIDLVWPDHMPPDFRDYHVHGGMHSLKRVMTWDFDHLITSHGRMGTMEDVDKLYRYLDTLFTQILVYVREEKSLQEIHELVVLDDTFMTWDGAEESIADNIDTMYRYALFYRDPTRPNVAKPYPPPGPETN